VKSYIGQDGKLVKFDADTTVSAGNESYKMWVDEKLFQKATNFNTPLVKV